MATQKPVVYDWRVFAIKFLISLVVFLAVSVWIVGTGQITAGKLVLSVFVALFVAFFKPSYKKK